MKIILRYYIIKNINIKKRNDVKCFIFRYKRNNNYKEKYILRKPFI